MASQVAVVDIPDDDDDDPAAASPPALRKRSHTTLAATDPAPYLLDFSPSPTLSKRRPPASPIVLDDTPTPPMRRAPVAPEKPPPVVAETDRSVFPCSPGSRAAVAETRNSVLPCSSLFSAAVTETPGSAVQCSIGADIVVTETPGFASPRKLSGVSCPISLDSDDELDDTGCRESLIKVPSNVAKSKHTNMIHPSTSSYSEISETNTDQEYHSRLSRPQTSHSAHKINGTTKIEKSLHADIPCENSTLWVADDFTQKQSLQKEKKSRKEESGQPIEVRKEKQQEEKRLKKEAKARLIEERKQKREENKKQKEAMKIELAEKKRLDKEKKKWESWKLASKSIIVQIDSTIVESGSVGGVLLSRLACKENLNINSRLIQLGDRFCGGWMFLTKLLSTKLQHRKCHIFSLCFKLRNSAIFEQSQYKNPSNSNSWKRPPVEEVLSKLATHYVRVHSRQCTDEAEVADHVAGLTSSLANCRFRKPLTWLSVHANGAIIPKDFIDKALAKKDNWYTTV